jgi:hypothetical protein
MKSDKHYINLYAHALEVVEYLDEHSQYFKSSVVKEMVLIIRDIEKLVMDIREKQDKEAQKMEAFMRHAITKEAAASVALDKDPDCHTCHNECTEYPQCPGRKE